MSLYISPMSKVIFSQNENNYCLENSTAEVLGIYGIILLINTCKYLNTTFADTETIKIDLSDIEYFKEYEYLNKNLINLFAQQNNMSFNTKKVDLFIKDNFLALSGVSKTLTYIGEDTTNLTSLPNEMLSKIFSYLKLFNVEHSVQCADDQTTPLLGEEPTE